MADIGVKKKRGSLSVRKTNTNIRSAVSNRIKRNTILQPELVNSPTRTTGWLFPSLVVFSFLLGIITSFAAWGRRPMLFAPADIQPVAISSPASKVQGNRIDFNALMQQVNPPEGYKIPARYGDLGPELIEAGVIEPGAFAAVYENAGNPLTAAQLEILNQGSDEEISISPENSYFLLNFFWAVGLANQNTILTKGAMVQNSAGRIETFASTGGWTLAAKPITEIYASLELIPLTPKQQARVEEVASAVYRPCCNNPTLFPDCNHGMAMLGLLELMASQEASTDEMFEAAKYVNAFWFPQQALQTAIYLKASQNIDFANADARLVTGKDFFSGSGSGQVYASLQSSGLLPTAPGSSGSCGT